MDSTAYFIQKIDLLQKKVDSLSSISLLDQANFKIHDQTSIINQIDSFYNSAWLKLLFVITLLGIIIPIIINQFQKKTFKDLTEFILNQIKDNYDNKIQELKIYNDAQIKIVTDKYSKDLGDLESKSKQAFYISEGSLYHLQAMIMEDSRQYALALANTITSCRFLVQGNVYGRAEQTLEQALRLMPLTSKEEVNKITISRFKSYKKSLDIIKKSDVKRLKEIVEKIEEFLS